MGTRRVAGGYVVRATYIQFGCVASMEGRMDFAGIHRALHMHSVHRACNDIDFDSYFLLNCEAAGAV